MKKKQKLKSLQSADPNAFTADQVYVWQKKGENFVGSGYSIPAARFQAILGEIRGKHYLIRVLGNEPLLEAVKPLQSDRSFVAEEPKAKEVEPQPEERIDRHEDFYRPRSSWIFQTAYMPPTHEGVLESVIKRNFG